MEFEFGTVIGFKIFINKRKYSQNTLFSMLNDGLALN